MDILEIPNLFSEMCVLSFNSASIETCMPKGTVVNRAPFRIIPLVTVLYGSDLHFCGFQRVSSDRQAAPCYTFTETCATSAVLLVKVTTIEIRSETLSLIVWGEIIH